MNEYVAFIVLIFLIIFYFLPSIIAFKRDHHAKIGILIINTIIGWTIIAWVVTLIWAYSTKRSVIDELEKLATLRDKGVLCEEEFQLQKKKLLQS